MARIVTVIAALAGAVVLLVGIMQARSEATSEGAAGSALLIGAGVVLLTGALIAFIVGRRRTRA